MALDKKSLVSASELGKLGVCERKVYLEAKYGKRKANAESQHNIDRGNQIHAQAYKKRYQTEHRGKDKRCYIATCVYGENAKETVLFRTFRDEHLLNNITGIWFVKVYYKLSPTLVRLFGEYAIFGKLMRLPLGLIYMILKKK